MAKCFIMVRLLMQLRYAEMHMINTADVRLMIAGNEE